MILKMKGNEPQRRPEYPELETLLALRGMSLQPIYTYREVARIFGRSVRAIQGWVQKGILRVRYFARPRFLPADLEEFLVNSKKKPGSEK